MLDRFYHQPITYWAVSGRDRFSAETFAAPVTFLGRWEDQNQEVLNHKGDTIISKASVHYPSTVNIQIDGFLAQGNLNNSDPRQVAGAYRVAALSSKPDLRNLEQVKVALL